MPDEPIAGALAVLLVEDVPLQLMDAAETLREAGMRVVEAATVDAATSALDTDPGLRAMVTDIDLSGEPLNGLALAKAVAARWPEVAVLLVSGFVQPETEALPQGARFLRKPFEPETLIGAVRDLVAAREAGTLEPETSEISEQSSP